MLCLSALALSSAIYQWRGGGGPGCGSRAAPGVLWRALLHNRWDVFASAEEHVVWEIAPARLSDGAVVDLWRGTEEVSWAVPEEEAPAHGGRWRSLPLTAERGEDEEAQFWGALCDEWEARERERVRRAASSGRRSRAGAAEAAEAAAAAARTVVGFHFYLLAADILPAPAPVKSGSEDDFETLVRAQLARMGYDASALPPGTGAQVAAVAHVAWAKLSALWGGSALAPCGLRVYQDGFHGNLLLPVGITCIEARVKVVEAGMAKPMNWGALTPLAYNDRIKELSALERELAALKKAGAEARKEAADAAAAAAGGAGGGGKGAAYGPTRKRLLKAFSCADRASLRLESAPPSEGGGGGWPGGAGRLHGERGL